MSRTQAIKRAMRFVNQCAIHGYAVQLYVHADMVSVSPYLERWPVNNHMRREWRWK